MGLTAGVFDHDLVVPDSRSTQPTGARISANYRLPRNGAQQKVNEFTGKVSFYRAIAIMNDNHAIGEF